MTRITFTILIFVISAFAQDKLFKHDGTTELVKVAEISDHEIKFRKIDNLDGPLFSTKLKSIDSVQYENGKVDRFSVNEPITHPLSVSIETMAGSFGLFNVQDGDSSQFTKGELSIGVIPMIDYRFSKHLAAGVECMTFWGKPKSEDAARLIINTNLRGRVIFPIRSRLNLETILAGGVSIWPKSDSIAYIEPTLNRQRQGWNIRGGFGADFAMNDRLSLVGDLGYCASSSRFETNWITHDFMLVTLGLRFGI